MDAEAMAIRPRQTERPDPLDRPAKSQSPDPYFPTSPTPLPEVIEKDSDSVWAMWNDAIEGHDEKPKDFDTHAATLIMDLQELPKPADDS